MDVPDTVWRTAVVSREKRQWWHQEDWYVAQAREIEMIGQGETLEEALADLRGAAELYFEDEPVPDPASPVVKQHGVPGVSGWSTIHVLGELRFQLVGTRGNHRKLRRGPAVVIVPLHKEFA